MLSDEEKVRLVEENLQDCEIKGKANIYFCRGSDNRYYFATVIEEGTQPNIKYFGFDFSELVAFIADIVAVIEEDKDRLKN